MSKTPNYRKLVESLRAIPWEMDLPSFRFTYVGQQAEDMLGYPREAWYAEGFWLQRVHPDDRDAAYRLCTDAVERGEDHSFEYRMLARDGHEVWVRDDVTLTRGARPATTLSGFMFDITESKTRQRAVEESEARLASSQEIARLGSWSLQVGSGQVELSREASRLLGFEHTGFATLDGLLSATAPDERGRLRAALDESIAVGRPLSTEHRIHLPAGGKRTVLSQARVTGSEDGGRTLVGTVQDISERREVEEAMAALAQVGRTEEVGGFLRDCVRNLAQHYGTRFAFIGLLQPDGKRVRTEVVWAGEDFGDNFEYALAGTPCENVMDRKKALTPRDAARLYPEDELLVQMGIESYFGAPLVGADGRTLGVLSVMDVKPLELQLWTAPILGLYASRIAVEVQRTREATRAKETEAQLQQELFQARKLESAGRLAGGIAHDFNNLLTVILGSADLLQSDLGEAPADLDHIVEAAERARELTAQMLAFSRKQLLQPQALDLNAVVRDMHGMLGRLIGEHITLRLDLPPQLGTVVADRTQVEQVLLNLVVNARDAMPAGGVITVGTADVCDPWPGQQGEFVELWVADDGEGMDAETLEQVFEPFFSTKAPGQGTGLGLATTYGVAKQSGGDVRVVSAPGEGARFRVVLPRAGENMKAAPSTKAQAVGAAALAAGKTRGRVLVVEDNAAVRGIATRVLSQAGFEVREASELQDAVARATANGGIDLVLVDFALCGTTGDKVVERLRTIQPGLPALFMSGYMDREFERDPRTDFIGKPFTRQRLVDQVLALIAPERS